MTLTMLGWAVMHSLWVSTLVAGLSVAVLSLLPDRRARTRHQIAYGALVLMVIAPLAVAVADADPLGQAMRFPLMQAVDGTIGLQTVVTWRAFLIPSAAILWLVGVCVSAIRFGRECRRARLLTRCDLAEAGEPARRLVNELRAQLFVRPIVDVHRSRWASVPMVLGWRRPVILLPGSSSEALPLAQLRAILAHELAHVSRRDYPANVLQMLAETLLFHHPAARWISRRIRIEREYCCDDVAVGVGGDPADYARALAALDEARDDCRLAVAAASGTLLDRIQRIVGHPRPVLTPARGIAALIAAAAVAGVLLALTSVVPPGLPLDVKLRSKVPDAESPVPPAGDRDLPRRRPG